ncbi:hypothetical protein N7456_003081 [Penicillium angulare]|uniref:O-methyltransferase C-terminal domain-containing protein n=1 Tax=Penicillium angulare TaxID=116970 RepID=A0A9W9FTY3_9EURO|nr:hypothetical protein N7456_003081 [Penicillium angulare]
MDNTSIADRAAEISELSHSIANFLAKSGQPEPSFEHGLPDALNGNSPNSDDEAIANRMKLLGLLDEFKDLLSDPASHLSPESRNPCLSVHSIARLRIADHVPKEGIDITDLAKKLNLDQNIVRRLMAHAATYHVFFQPERDYFVHTASSRLLAENDGMRSWLLTGIEESLAASMRIPDVLEKYGYSEDPEKSAWSMHNSTKLPVFVALNEMPERGMTFSKAMAWHSQLPGFSAHHLIDHLPFKDSKSPTTIVDVGGGYGHIAQALASHNPNFQCVVQDLSEPVAQGEKILPQELQGRVRFEVHDFFKEQPIKDADVYLLRHTLHDWSNKYAMKVLKCLIPALKSGGKIVINDRIIPDFGEAHYLLERESRDYDFYMFTLTNAQERTLLDWENLLRVTDSRLKMTRVSRPEKSFFAIMEVTLEE